MAKYDPLRDHLAKLTGPDWWARFGDVERIIGAKLPPSARGQTRLRGTWWWTGRSLTRPHVRAWTDAGWYPARVDLASEIVVFRRSNGRLRNPVRTFEQGQKRCHAPLGPGLTGGI